MEDCKSTEMAPFEECTLNLYKSTEEISEEEKYFTIRLSKRLKVDVYKPLISLKIGIFLWMIASSSAMVYFFVYLKQRGLTIQHVMMITTMSGIISILHAAGLAVIIDRVGRSKLILITIILAASMSLLSITFLPALKSCTLEKYFFHCHERNLIWMGSYNCSSFGKWIQTELCEITCTNFINPNRENEVQDCIKFFESRTENITLPYPLQNSFKFYRYPDLQSAHSKLNQTFCKNNWNNTCSVSCPTKETTKCLQKENWLLVIYFFLTIYALAMYANVFRFFDVTAAILVKKHNVNYGEVRVWAIVGLSLGSVLSGIIVNVVNPVEAQDHYTASFYLYAIICLLTVIAVCKIDICKLDPGTKMWKKSLLLLRNPDVFVFFAVICVLGTTMGFKLSFTAWYLSDMGAEAYVYSLVNIGTALYGLPFLIKSEWFLNKIGDTNLFILALLANAMNLFAYSVIYKAWIAILLEITSIFSYHLLWMAVINFCIRITPVGVTAVVNSTAGSIHWAIGRIMGSFLGGLLINNFGERLAFRILGLVNILVSFLYGVFSYYRNKTKLYGFT